MTGGLAYILDDDDTLIPKVHIIYRLYLFIFYDATYIIVSRMDIGKIKHSPLISGFRIFK